MGPWKESLKPKTEVIRCPFSSSKQELDFNLTTEKAFVPPVGGTPPYLAPLEGPKMAPMTLKEGSHPSEVPAVHCW